MKRSTEKDSFKRNCCPTSFYRLKLPCAETTSTTTRVLASSDAVAEAVSNVVPDEDDDGENWFSDSCSFLHHKVKYSKSGLVICMMNQNPPHLVIGRNANYRGSKRAIIATVYNLMLYRLRLSQTINDVL